MINAGGGELALTVLLTYRTRSALSFFFAFFVVPFFTLEQELLTPTGKGRLAGDIGKLINDKLVRLLSRLVMRETLKTSTLTSVVIASLALDTDARGRRQGKHNKSLNPPPVQASEPAGPPGAERWGEYRDGSEREEERRLSSGMIASPPRAYLDAGVRVVVGLFILLEPRGALRPRTAKV